MASSATGPVDEWASLDNWSRELLEQTLASLHEALFIVRSPQRTIAYCNDRAVEMFGYPREEMIGQSTRLLHVDDRSFAEFDRRGLPVLAEKGVFRCEFRMRRKNGEVFWSAHTVSEIIDAGGERVAALSLVRDVNHRREIEIEIKEREAYFRTIVNAVADIISIIEPNGTYRFVSDAVITTLGYEPGELVGNNALEHVHPDDVAEARERLAEVLETPGSVVSAELRYRASDGSWRQLEAVAHNLIGRAPIDGILMSTRDVTETRLLEAKLRQSEKLEAIGRLAGGVAHDFNNLLTAIRGYSRFLLDAPSLPDNWRDDVEQIARAGERAGDLTARLLAFTRQDIWQEQVVDLNALLEDSLRMLRRLVASEVDIVLEPESTSPLVYCDPGQLESMIINLVVNANDAISKSGRIRLRTSDLSVAQGDADSERLAPGSWVVFEVEDTGSGMSEEVRKKAFDAFYTTKPPGQGTGLGLATVKGIVERCGGLVEIESEEDSGTTVSVTLPRSEDGEGRSAAASAEEPGGGSETILVVEDQAVVLAFVKRVLKEYGYTVIGVADPGDARRVLAERGARIDLLLTDIVMPEERGTELAAHARQVAPGIRVMYMSGYSSLAAEGEFADPETGEPVPLLFKPFDPDELLRRIRQTLADSG